MDFGVFEDQGKIRMWMTTDDFMPNRTNSEEILAEIALSVRQADTLIDSLIDAKDRAASWNSSRRVSFSLAELLQHEAHRFEILVYGNTVELGCVACGEVVDEIKEGEEDGSV